MRLPLPTCLDCGIDVEPLSSEALCENCYEATHCEHCDNEIERSTSCQLCAIEDKEAS